MLFRRVVLRLPLTFGVFISVVEKHKTKFRIKTKKYKYKLNIELNQKPQLNKHAVSKSFYYE